MCSRFRFCVCYIFNLFSFLCTPTASSMYCHSWKKKRVTGRNSFPPFQIATQMILYAFHPFENAIGLVCVYVFIVYFTFSFNVVALSCNTHTTQTYAISIFAIQFHVMDTVNYSMVNDILVVSFFLWFVHEMVCVWNYTARTNKNEHFCIGRIKIKNDGNKKVDWVKWSFAHIARVGAFYEEISGTVEFYVRKMTF